MRGGRKKSVVPYGCAVKENCAVAAHRSGFANLSRGVGDMDDSCEQPGSLYVCQ